MRQIELRNKGMVGIYFASLIFGILLTNFAAHRYATYINQLNFMVYDLDKLSQISSNEFFLSLLLKRGRQFLVLYIAGLFLPTILVFGLYLAFFSFSLSCFLCIQTVQSGFYGILSSFFYFFPQYICYILLFFICYYRIKGKKESLPFREERKIGGKYISKVFIRWMVVIAILLGGCFLEAYINPMLLQYIGR